MVVLMPVDEKQPPNMWRLFLFIKELNGALE